MAASKHLPTMYHYDEGGTDLDRTFDVSFSAVPDELQQFVECICCNRTARPDCARVPEGIGHVVFVVTRWQRSAARVAEIGDAALLFSGPHTVKHPMPLGNGETIVAQLRPGAARTVFGVPAHWLTNQIVSAHAVRGASARHALDRLVAAPSSRARVAIFTAMLSGWVRPARDDTFTVRAAAWMQSRREWRAGALAAKSGYSERHTRRLFEDCLGLSPKAYARTLRLHAVLQMATRTTDLAEIAAAAGYYDQAHLTQDFRTCVGRPPASFFGDREAARLSRFGIVLDADAAIREARPRSVASPETRGALLQPP